MDVTTIKIERETKTRLERLKEHERETFNQVIKKILYILNQIRKDPISGNRVLGNIDRNVRKRKVFSSNLKKESASLQHNPQQDKGSY